MIVPIYEFLCPQGHTTEQLLSVKDRDLLLPCATCIAERARGNLKDHVDITAQRILSPTPTTFVHAGGRKR